MHQIQSKSFNLFCSCLFFYGSGSSISHVGIYIGNGQIVHASNARTGIKISSAYYRTPICVISYLN